MSILWTILSRDREEAAEEADSRNRPYNLSGYDSWKTRSPYDEGPERSHGPNGCPPRSGCVECFPQCAGCGRSVGTHGSWCNHCEEAADALPESDEFEP